MRLRLMLLILVVGWNSPSLAQNSNNRRPSRGDCDARSCDEGPALCKRGQCAPPAQQPLQTPLQQPQPAGMFVVPPQSGIVESATGSVGIRGMELEFPAIRLRFPSITLPSLFRTRQNARMVMNEASAPYVQSMHAQASPIMAQPLTSPNMGHAQGADIQQLQRALQAAREQKNVECDQRLNATRAATEAARQRLQELEALERRIDQKIEKLQQCLQDLLSAQDRVHSRLSIVEQPSMGQHFQPSSEPIRLQPSPAMKSANDQGRVGEPLGPLVTEANYESEAISSLPRRLPDIQSAHRR